MPRAAPGARRGGVGHPPPPTGRTSLRTFAKAVRVSHPAVVKAIRSGRLKRSIGRDAKGRPFIADTRLAAQEWVSNATKPGPGRPGALTLPASGEGKTNGKVIGLVDAQILQILERTRGLEMVNDLRAGRQVDAAEEERRHFEVARTVQNAILTVPDRCASELAAEMDAGKVHARLDQELRQALEAIAEILDALE